MATTVAVVVMGTPSSWPPGIFRIAPYIIMSAGVFLGWRFNRTRVFFILIVILVAERFLYTYAFGSKINTELGLFVFNITCILLPLNLTAFSMDRERGLFTKHALLRLSLIAVQPWLALLLFKQFPELNRLFESKLFQPEILVSLAIPHWALIVFIVCFFILILGYFREPDTIKNSFVWSLILVLLALLGGKGGAQSSFYLNSIGILFVLSLVEMSYKMAYRDELTGLPGRRAFTEALERLGQQFTIALIDVDHFKKINDRYGHDTGDQVLKMVAGKLTMIKKGGGTVYRYGGEEFICLFAGKDQQTAVPFLKNLCKTIANTTFVIRTFNRPKHRPQKVKPTKKKKTIRVTISIGTAEKTESQHSPRLVIKAADKALYRAKKLGRNRVRSHLATRKKK